MVDPVIRDHDLDITNSKTCPLSYHRVSHNRLPGCPRQPFLPVGQPKVDPLLLDRATKSFVICLCIYIVGQPKCLVGQPQIEIGCPTGKPIFKTNVKPCTTKHYHSMLTTELTDMTFIYNSNHCFNCGDKTVTNPHHSFYFIERTR